MNPGKETDPLCQSLEEAVQAAAALSATGMPVKSREEPEHPAMGTTSTYQKNPIIPCETGKSRTVWNPASTAFNRGLLHEFSWHGRLEKLLLGQSDRPLPAIIQAPPGGAP
jgi:predicted deacylase